jgi:hypothetical protein
MRVLFLAFGLALLLGVSFYPASAQEASTCSALVERALAEMGANCGGLGRNAACYGYNRVSASFTQEFEAGYFSDPADVAELLTLRTIATAPLNEASGEWGVAVMNVQANLPSALPGQSVTFLLMGDAQVENAVPPEQAFAGGTPIPVTTASFADLHSGPARTTNLITSLPAGAPLAADAISPDGAWLRAANDQTGGWVELALLQPADVTSLPTLTGDAYTPMQAFYFDTGLGTTSCQDAPDALLVQGPQTIEVSLNVNGVEVNVGSTVQLISMREAPERILNNINLPPRVLQRLQQNYAQPDSSGEMCKIQHLRVLSGSARLNGSDAILPAGNAAWSAYCLRRPLEEIMATAFPTLLPSLTPVPSATPDIMDQPSGGGAGGGGRGDSSTGSQAQPPAAAARPDDMQIGSPAREMIVSFVSEWGAFRPATPEELASIQVFQRLPPNVLNYKIDLPAPEEIVPVGGS